MPVISSSDIFQEIKGDGRTPFVMRTFSRALLICRVGSERNKIRSYLGSHLKMPHIQPGEIFQVTVSFLVAPKKQIAKTQKNRSKGEKGECLLTLPSLL